MPALPPTRPPTPHHGLAVVSVALACCLGSVSHAGESPAASADKITAREAATEGIRLYRAGQFRAALEQLERAQKHYQAPVHHLYIARSQKQIGQWVESFESYQVLLRSPPQVDAPAPVVNAFRDGKTELEALKLVLPSIRLQFSPRDAAVSVAIDGVEIPADVVGTKRAINPGAHSVRVTAPGYQVAEQSLMIGSGESQTLSLVLTPAVGPSAVSRHSAPPVDPETNHHEDYGFLFGLRLHGVLPGGEVYQDLPMGDFFQAGAGFEFRAGFRFMRYLTGVAYTGVAGLGDGSQINHQPAWSDDSVEIGAVWSGLGVVFSTPRDEWGGFGELGMASRSVSLKLDDGAGCRVDVSGTATDLRIGGGAHLPISKSLRLTPYMLLSLGGFKSLSDDSDCDSPFRQGDSSVEKLLGGIDSKIQADGSIPSDDQSGHLLFLFGLGGEYLFGDF